MLSESIPKMNTFEPQLHELRFEHFETSRGEDEEMAFSNSNFPAVLIDDENGCPIKLFESNPRFADSKSTRGKVTLSPEKATKINLAFERILKQFSPQCGDVVLPVSHSEQYGHQLSIKFEHDDETGSIAKSDCMIVCGDRAQKLTMSSQLTSLNTCRNLVVRPLLYSVNGKTGVTLRAVTAYFLLQSTSSQRDAWTLSDGPRLALSNKNRTLVTPDDKAVNFPVQDFAAKLWVSEDNQTASVKTSDASVVELCRHLDSIFHDKPRYLPLVKESDQYGAQARIKFRFQNSTIQPGELQSNVTISATTLSPYWWERGDTCGLTLYLEDLNTTGNADSVGATTICNAIPLHNNTLITATTIGPPVDKSDENRLPLVYFNNPEGSRLHLAIGQNENPCTIGNPELPDAYKRPDAIPNVYVGLESREVESIQLLETQAKEYVKINKESLFGDAGWTDDQIEDAWQDCLQDGKVKMKINQSIAKVSGPPNTETLDITDLPATGSGIVVAQPYLYFNGDVKAKGKKKRKLVMCGMKLSALKLTYSHVTAARSIGAQVGQIFQLSTNLKVTMVDDLVSSCTKKQRLA